MIRDLLKVVGINIRKTSPDEYGREGDAGLELMARIIHYTSGDKPSLEALRMRLTRVDHP